MLQKYQTGSFYLTLKRLGWFLGCLLGLLASSTEGIASAGGTTGCQESPILRQCNNGKLSPVNKSTNFSLELSTEMFLSSYYVVYVCMPVCTYVCMYVCMYVYMYVCVAMVWLFRQLSLLFMVWPFLFK